MKLTVIFGILLALALGAPATAQASIVDTQLEVTTALVQSNLTIEAVKKADDARCRELQARIDALTAQVKAGTAQKADLVAAKQALVGRLSETDAGYKAEIAAFRGAVTDIASTPEGLAALARYNAGDQAGALAILDKLQAAYERATDVQRAVGERRIAELALDARDKGKVTTASVVDRYEAVVKLDPAVFRDWIDLDRLYQAAGRITDARQAAETAERLARNDYELSASLSDLADILSKQGDLAGARKADEQQLATVRRLANADPSDESLNIAVAEAVTRTGDVLKAQGELGAASADYDEGLKDFRRLSAADPSNTVLQDGLVAALERRGNILVIQGDLSGARNAFEEDVALSRRLAAEEPDSPAEQDGVAVSLERYGEILSAQGDLGGARMAYEEELAIDRRAVVSDPSDTAWQHSVGAALEDSRQVLLAQGDLAGASKAYQEELATFQHLSAADPNNTELRHDVVAAMEGGGDIQKAQGDLAGAGKLYQAALAISRRLVAADPSNADWQHDVVWALFGLATTGGSDLHWTDVVAQFEAMDRQGLLQADDRPFLDLARQNAAAEATR